MNEFDSVNCEHLEYKKIAKRFLKELGLYNAWVMYIKTEYKLASKKIWYERHHIDRIFGDTLFTSFLYRKYGVILEATISDIFRYYVIKNNIKCVLKFPLRTYDLKNVEKIVDINKCTGKISFKEGIWMNLIGKETGN